MAEQFRVRRQLDERHPKNVDYPLLPGDIVVQHFNHPDDVDPDLDLEGTWSKMAPGLCMVGFRLTDADVAELEPADDARWTIA